jgi:mannose-1-phosphate guanylyltransferase/mannose-6-phosphate isomerase
MSDLGSPGTISRPLIPVVISGGSGTRLWPRSRETRPKQFLPLVGTTSLFQQTLLRVQQLGLHARSPIVVCNAAHREFVLTQARELRIRPTVVLEPVGRNTAPAVALAALLAIRDSAAAADPLLLVLPADHVIADARGFAAAVRVATEAAESGRLVTFGALPDRPETGYGYILHGERHGEWAEIGKFVEKPDLETAEGYVASGKYSWNSGMFLFSASRLLEELRAQAPDILEVCEQAVGAAREEGGALRLGAAFARCPANSLDYAVMEKTASGAVVPLAAGWSDVGSWAALHDVSPRDAQGNTASGDAMLESCRNTYISAGSRLVAAVGLDDVVVVETEDAVLVLRRDRAQDVKKIVDELRARRRNET